MTIGDSTYRPTERDLVATDASPTRLFQGTSSSSAAASIQADTATCPGDEVWIITGLNLQANPGAAQTATSVSVQIWGAGTVFLGNVATYGPGDLSAVAAAQNQKNLTGMMVMVMPGEFVRILGVFNAGAAANAIGLQLMGQKVPRGNILR